MKKAMVVNVRNAAYDVLIDRTTMWGNPWTHEKNKKTRALHIVATRVEAIAKYVEWIKTQPRLIAALHTLKDQVLGCWCAPFQCHGDALIGLLDELCVDCAKQLRNRQLGVGARCLECYQDATIPDDDGGK